VTDPHLLLWRQAAIIIVGSAAIFKEGGRFEIDSGREAAYF